MRNKYFVLLASLIILIYSDRKAKAQGKSQEYIYHYSILSALNDKVYTGNLKIKDLKKHGDLGLGTYNFLEGEMVIVNGTVYKILPEGKIVEAQDNELSPYAMITKFDVDKSFKIENIKDYEALKTAISKNLPSENIFYAIQIKGIFGKVKCGTVTKQNPPFTKRLKKILDNRPVYEATNLSGTLVGLWCPEYMIDINAPGYHLHFIADDKSIGGHLLDIQITNAEAEIDVIRGYRLELPDNKEFDETKLRLNDPEDNY